ncbi:hypothetical protein LXL04_006003 [Taraxacum kok-saghyz]
MGKQAREIFNDRSIDESRNESNIATSVLSLDAFLDRSIPKESLPSEFQSCNLDLPSPHSCEFPFSFAMSVESAITNNVNGGSVFSNGEEKKPFRIFVGYDTREDVAYEVCWYSILKRSSIPVEVIPIKQSELREKKYFWRERNYAMMCVQHDYTPKETTKMDGAVQTAYPRKNWSSMVLYNCGHPKNKILTPWFKAWKDCEFGDLWLKELEEYDKVKEKEKLG